MFWIIDTDEALEYLVHKTIQEAFIEIIPYHDNIHPALNGLSLVLSGKLILLVSSGKTRH